MTSEEHDFVAGYTEAMMWANAMVEVDGEIQSKDCRGEAWPTESARDRIQEDCLDFFGANQEDLEIAHDHPSEGRDYESLGHDFALSRNGHGAGYFDRGKDPVWRRLQAAAKVYGEQCLMVDSEGHAEIM